MKKSNIGRATSNYLTSTSWINLKTYSFLLFLSFEENTKLYNFESHYITKFYAWRINYYNHLFIFWNEKAERKHKLHFLFQQKSRNCVTAQRIPIKMKGEKNTFQGCRSWAQIWANQLILFISTGEGGRLCPPHV